MTSPNPLEDLLAKISPRMPFFVNNKGDGKGSQAHHQAFNPLVNLPQFTAAVAGLGGVAYGAIDWANRQLSGLGASPSDSASPNHVTSEKNVGDMARRWWPGGRKKRIADALGTDALPGSGWGEAYRLAEEGLQLEGRMQVEEAARVFERVVALDPKNAPFVARLSKQYSDMTYLPGMTDERAREANIKAIELAQKAIETDPNCVLGYLADCIGKGRLALLSDNRSKIKLAKEARESAVKAITLDPQNDIALHLMGRWHVEMANINFLARALVSVMYGTSLPEGNYRDALQCYEDAIKVCPQKLIHRVEAGRLHLRSGDRARAQSLLESALNLEVTDINDYLTKIDASKLLKECKGGVLV